MKEGAVSPREGEKVIANDGQTAPRLDSVERILKLPPLTQKDADYVNSPRYGWMAPAIAFCRHRVALGLETSERDLLEGIQSRYRRRGCKSILIGLARRYPKQVRAELRDGVWTLIPCGGVPK